MRVVYMGNPAFAVPSLIALHQSAHQLVAVVTSPDKPSGRGRRLKSTPVKDAAQELGYPLLQPDELDAPEFLGHLRDLAADLFVVLAFKILPEAVLEIPPRGVINLHPSLLPAYRGAAPIQ
ncbi:MAG: methionyl-tRNA formyltransferase, partial [Candidatus Marinimicrobia bacterium]|nr:methionyl-tRNA formyltransferase [Candidatus Neomarinimicrobiota bacterium]